MILDEICRHKKQELVERKQKVPRETLEKQIEENPPARDFRLALREPGISLIAEVKRASPSKGVMMSEDVNPADIAFLYEQGGARAISVLTDQRYFHGCLQDLTLVRQNVSLPCLRKEFIIDPYQIYEARAAGADAILLIVRILTNTQLESFLSITRSLGMAALVETHNEEEIRRALDCGAHIIGINNRDLATFTVDINTTLRLRRLVPGGHVLVSESGIHTREHVQILEDGGIDALLVGEALISSNGIVEKIQELLGINES